MGHWLIFGFIVITLFIIDLNIFNKKDSVISFSKNIIISIFYIIIACIYGAYIHYQLGTEPARQYFTGYIIEKAMALDNIFVISLIFEFFRIPTKYQHKVLLWGILGVIISRGVLIKFGSELISRYHWILYILAIILILTGISIIRNLDKKLDVNDFYFYKILKKYTNITDEIHGDKFFLKINNKYFITPLFAALIIIETIDVIFAMDSIPAIFAITTDPYIIYTSNIFAILGLRSLYFCLGEIIEKFKYIKYSLALILIVIGIKIFADIFIHISTYFTLISTVMLLFAGIVFSILKK